MFKVIGNVNIINTTQILIGYALKKVLKVVAVIVGLFFAGLVYLQYQQIIDIKWAKFQAV
ncbi:MAG: FUN14 domain-containing protein [Nitrososphaeraceae archaeon]|nr:FUN14 domain-containing protein [Nitrososphaeraceae archaeon]MBV9668336.1 FUN14 domain-containing protein [Nitrososphaeraceae archaeon]